MSSLRPSAPSVAAALPKVQRYWAGAEPAYAAPAAGDANAGPQLSAASVLAARARPATNMKLSGAKTSGRKPRAEIVMAGEDEDDDAAPVVRRKPPSRAAPTAEVVLEGDDIERFEQAQEEREVQARMAAAERGLNEDDEEARALESRRARARQAAAAHAAEEDENAVVEEVLEDDDSDVEYEYVDDDEEDEPAPSLPPAPMFIPRNDRETIKAERESEEALEKKRIEEEERKEEERIAESRKLVEESLQREKEEQAVAMETGAESECESTDSEGDDADEEFEKWKVRELRRIKKSHEEALSSLKDQAEIDARRRLSDADIRRLDADRLRRPEKKKLRFLQKFWHKGAFYQEDEIMKRDYSAPVGGEQTVNKELLPKIMQVKNFGKMGRTKYTHLADQDTTNRDAGWANADGLGALRRNAPAELKEIEAKRVRRAGDGSGSGSGSGSGGFGGGGAAPQQPYY